MKLLLYLLIVAADRLETSLNISTSIVIESVNYTYYQAEQLCSIGSGAVESAIKQIDLRLKLVGAQWKSDNVNQILQLRCAYLNDQLAI